jgi:Rrf2 family nitric oxide-sensitive transcriptional repressor
MLSTTAEYAMRIMIALTEGPEGAMTSERISRIAHIPTDYAVKVLQLLGRSNLVKAQRGRGGGFRLACDPAVTTLYDVVNAIDPLVRITKCPLDREMHATGLCPLHKCIDDVMGKLEAELRAMTLRNVVDDAEGSALCMPPSGEEMLPVTGRQPRPRQGARNSEGKSA